MLCILGVLAVSWYPPDDADEQGHPWDDLMPELLKVAHRYNLKVYCMHWFDILMSTHCFICQQGNMLVVSHSGGSFKVVTAFERIVMDTVCLLSHLHLSSVQLSCLAVVCDFKIGKPDLSTIHD